MPNGNSSPTYEKDKAKRLLWKKEAKEYLVLHSTNPGELGFASDAPSVLARIFAQRILVLLD